MGILSYGNVDDWQGAVLKERREIERGPDDAGPIGRRAPSPIKHTATWIRLDPASFQLTYGPEKEIEVYRGYEKLLPADLRQKMGMREIRGWLFQIREKGPNRQPGSFSLLRGKEILLSKLPHSRNYFVRRTLKPCKHEKAVWKRVSQAWDKHPDVTLADERLDCLLQELSVTPFVSFNKGCLAAWAVTPKRFDVLGEERFDMQDDYTVAALDIPFDEAYEILRVDPIVQSALAATDDGSLFDGYQSVWDVKAASARGMRPGKGPVRHTVTEELRRNREQLMEAACWAALCGREVPDAHDSVAESAALLYHRFAYNFVERKPSPGDNRTGDEGAQPKRGGSFEEDRAKREFTAHWRELGYIAAVETLVTVIDEVPRVEEDQIDESARARMRTALAGWPFGWKRPVGLDQALQRLSKIRK